MDIKKLVLSDEALNVVDNGAWVGELPDAEGVELLVRALSSDAVQGEILKNQIAMRVQNDGKPLSSDQLASSTRKALADVGLLGWRGLTDNGQEISYSNELASQWLNSRNGKKLANLVLTAAMRIDEDASAYVGQVAKN